MNHIPSHLLHQLGSGRIYTTVACRRASLKTSIHQCAYGVHLGCQSVSGLCFWGSPHHPKKPKKKKTSFFNTLQSFPTSTALLQAPSLSTRDSSQICVTSRSGPLALLSSSPSATRGISASDGRGSFIALVCTVMPKAHLNLPHWHLPPAPSCTLFPSGNSSRASSPDVEWFNYASFQSFRRVPGRVGSVFSQLVAICFAKSLFFLTPPIAIVDVRNERRASDLIKDIASPSLPPFPFLSLAGRQSFFMPAEVTCHPFPEWHSSVILSKRPCQYQRPKDPSVPRSDPLASCSTSLANLVPYPETSGPTITHPR